MATIAQAGIRQRYNEFVARHEVAWELTMAGLAVLFVLIGFAVDDAPAHLVAPLIALDLALTALFVAEFSSRLIAAPSRLGYLRGHWVDALALIPTARGIRLLRLLRLLRLVRAFSGVYHALDEVERIARHRGLLRLFLLWLGVAVISSGALFIAEIDEPGTRIREPFDALWWSVVTLATVGYGDITPVSFEGKVAAMGLIVLGITLWAAITGSIVSYFVSSQQAGQAESAADTLLKLGEARAQGLLTDAEFDASKQELLRRI